MKLPMYLCASLCVLFVLAVTSFSQTVVFSDDFSTNTNATYTTTGQIGTSSFSVTRLGADWGARRNTAPQQLELTNDTDGAVANANGWVFASTSASSFAAPYNTVLKSNPALVTWTFNLRQSRADPSGFTATNTYGAAFILATNTTSPDVGVGKVGYAVTLGETGTVDPIHLVRFTSGLQGTITPIIDSNTAGLSDLGAEFLSVKVTYNPSNNQWELFLRNDGTTSFADPSVGSLVSQGTAIDNTSTGVSLSTMGAYWQGSTAAGEKAFFDNVRVTVNGTGTLAFASGSSSFAEGAGSVAVTVNRSSGNAGSISADYSIANGTATGSSSCTSGVDYINTGGTLSFGNGETSKQINVTFCNDTVFEPNETFTIALSNPAGGAILGSPSSATITINNDDPNTLTVTKTADTNDGSCDVADCSLREAIAAAASGDTIVFSSLFNSVQTINLGSELLINGKDLTITGPGANLLTVNGTPGVSGVFIANNSLFNLSGMKIQGGAASATGGGAISVNGGRLILDSVYVTGNSAVSGGGIQITNTTSNNIIRNSTIAGNSATNTCGGVRIGIASSATIVNSTITGNNGAGIAGNGGGLCAEGVVTLRNSTVTGNTALQGGGIYVANTGGLDIGSTIVAGNTASNIGAEIFQAVSDSVVSSGFNLVGDSPNDSTNTNSPITYQSTDIRDTDPQLNPLANNGGPTPTQLPKTSPTVSPVIDKGFAFGQTSDQRGQSRTFDQSLIVNAAGGDGTDIGAVEVVSPTAAHVQISGRVVSVYGVGLSNVRVVLEGADPSESRAAMTNGFGYYVFDDVEAGKGYILSTQDGRHRFRDQSRFVMLNDQLWDVDFVAEP